jgi:hypothetical protein
MKTVQEAALIASKQGGNGQQQQRKQFSRYDNRMTNQAAYSALQRIKSSCGKLDGKRAMPLPAGGEQNYCDRMGSAHETCKPYFAEKATYGTVCTGTLAANIAKKAYGTSSSSENSYLCVEGASGYSKPNADNKCKLASGTFVPAQTAKEIAGDSTLRDDAIKFAKCYDSIPHSNWTAILDKIRPEAVAAHQVESMDAMGQNGPKITPTMCNAGYNGQFDTGNEYGVQDLAKAVGRNLSVQREN